MQLLSIAKDVKRDEMEYLLTIPSILNNLNDYILAERTNRHKGAKMKASNGDIAVSYTHLTLPTKLEV